ncbi:alpha/beta hydrolase [Rhizobium vallis]|uniref:Alpha/beta hydrolase n=1 Tax=Rhizobium vallis TaxID=634290 RepID=A0A3S0TF11_9HYPH|nr:alpha/beta hydrolase [Rhizobium vallis]RUM27371.1 alpha/beta hydrolase [Rhizobium vallis]
MILQAKAAKLKVPGAEIYYETHGAGPTLLVIPGGPQDAGVFAGLIHQLADRYTVIAYDPRGNSRSPFQGEPEELDVNVHADDAAALIAAVGDGPADVFGTSGGAQIGLNLAARHAGLVRTVVAHEPPCMMLMSDPSAMVNGARALYETYRSHGVAAAMGKFFADNGLSEGAAPQPELPPEAAETFARVSGNFEYWLAHGLLPLSSFRPDVDALRAGKPRVVVAIGEASAGQPIESMGRALAEKLGVPPVSFPGDHMGFSSDPANFASALDRTLSVTSNR